MKKQTPALHLLPFTGPAPTVWPQSVAHVCIIIAVRHALTGFVRHFGTYVSVLVSRELGF